MTLGDIKLQEMWFGCSGPVDSVIVNNILDSISDSLIVLGEDGEILYVNSITNAILGYGIEDFKKKGLHELFFSSDRNEKFKQVFLDALWKKHVKNYREVDYYHPNGSLRRLAATTSYLLLSGEQESTFIGFVALFKDITESFNLRRLEKAMMQERERVAREQANGLQKLAMAVAHEIRNPTVTIGGFANRILKKPDNPEEVAKAAQNILDDARRLEAMVAEVQEYSDLPEPNLSEGGIAQLVSNVVAELARREPERNITLMLKDDTPIGYRSRFDPDLLKIALVRLISNAMDFSKDGSHVDISLSASNHETVIEIRDYGIGIKEEDRDYIFNPFFSTRVHGSGMGLAIVKRVVRYHMGKIEVESEFGKGSLFRIILPYIPSPADSTGYAEHH